MFNKCLLLLLFVHGIYIWTKFTKQHYTTTKRYCVLVENLGVLAIYWRQWFILFPSPRKQKETRVFSSCSPLSLPKDSPDQLKQIEGSQLQGCKQIAITAQTIGNSKKL